MATDFTILSFNCEGVKRSCDYISNILNKTSCDIICLQEIWLLDNTIDYLSSVHTDYMYIGISGVDSNNNIIYGRPKGGVAILYKKSLSHNIVRMKSINRRVCGIKISSHNSLSCMLLNVYLPCDNYSNNDVTQEYRECIEYIETLHNSSDCEAFICCGDYNTSFERHNAQTDHLSNFILRNNL